MLCFIFLLYSLTVFSQKDSTDFSVLVELLEPATSDGINLKIHVTNLSGKQIKILKKRRIDYKWDSFRSSGNYVIEIEKWETESYQLFAPSAHIDPVHEKEEFLHLQNKSSLIDTVYIYGTSFSRVRGSSKKGFPEGNYRIRVCFNQNMWRTNEQNCSNWIEFKID